MKFNFVKDYSSELLDELQRAKPRGATGAYAFKWEYLLANFVRKLPKAGVSANLRRKRAIDKMLAANAKCGDINENGFLDESHSFKCVMARAATICGEVLKPYSHKVLGKSVFTSGATSSRQKRQGDPFYKYHRSHALDVTRACFPFAYALISATPRWAAEGGLHSINIVEGDLVTTVPKETEIDRSISKQPDLNALLQKGVGLAFEGFLREIGIDLRDQTTNQALAWIGSKDGSLATIDLTSASDSIAIRLVRFLFPNDWLEILESLRCEVGILPDGKSFRWEMFSSMGNGFTFGLETIIFYSLAKAVMEEASIDPVVGTNLAVYGDDIICPTECADRLIWVLSACGFTTNKSKTFTNGPFRESCGAHYYEGTDVTPFYVRKPIDTLERMLWFLNRLRLWAYDEDTKVCDPSVYQIWLKYRRRFIPTELLGGRNIDDISCLYSPEEPRFRLKFSTVTKKLVNWRGYLRWFQFASLEDVKYVSLVDEVSSYQGSDGSQSISTVSYKEQRKENGRVLPDRIDYVVVDAPWAECEIL